MGNGGSLSLTTLTSSVTKATLWGYDANQGLTGKPTSIDCGSAPLASGLMGCPFTNGWCAEPYR